MDPGFRRRILIEPASGRVTAELEDDYHRMIVTLEHDGTVVTAVHADMHRWPWTTCRGAIEQLIRTFGHVPLAAVARRGEKPRNCTHLHDLTVFAAAHAATDAPTSYDIHVTDPVEGVRCARLVRDGRIMLDWRLAGERLVTPVALQGRTLGDLKPVIDDATPDEAEAIRILRWACILALGRSMVMPAGMSASVFPPGSCYTFQPERAAIATRRPDADRDFSGAGTGPLADRPAFF